LCGNWNSKFLHNNSKLQDLQNLLLMYNLINVIDSPTRITSHSKSLIHIVIINNSKEKSLVEVLDMGYSDHLGQYVCMKSVQEQMGPIRMYKRQFTNMNTDYFKYLICDEKWIETIESDYPNSSFMLFKNTFIYYFDVAFPVKKIKAKTNYITQRWNTKGLIVSRNKLRILRKIKRMQGGSRKILEYIQIYQRILRKVLNEARRKESYRYVLEAKNKSKAIWELIKKVSGEFQKNQYITIIQGHNFITNPWMIADSFNK